MAFSAMSTFWQLNTRIPPPSITISPSVSNVTNTYATYTYYNAGQGKTYAIIVVTKGTVTVTPINRSLSFGYLAVGSGQGGGGITSGGSGGGVNIGDISINNCLTATPAVPAVLTVAQPGSDTTIVATTTITSVYASRAGSYNGAATAAYGVPGNANAGGNGLNLNTYALTDINLPSGTGNRYIAGGGGGSSDTVSELVGYDGGVGGGGGGYPGGGGGAGVITFGNANTFGFNGSNAHSTGSGNGGANTGSGGGCKTYYSGSAGSGGSGVILIYYLT